MCVLLLLFSVLGNKLYNDTFPWWKDTNEDFMITFSFQHKILGQIIPETQSFSHCCLRCGLILIKVFRFNEKYLIGKRVPEQKPHEMTSQKCNLIGYLTHVASNCYYEGNFKKSTENLCSLFSQRFSTITIHKHIDHI